MAKVTNAFTTYSAVGNREDLSNAIYNIDPFDTPVMSAIRRRNVKNRIFDWQTENLPAVNLSNAQFEGFALAPGWRNRRFGRTTSANQRADATVSGSQEKPTRRQEQRNGPQMAIMSKALKSDMESILCSRQARVDSNDSTARSLSDRSLDRALRQAPKRRGGGRRRRCRRCRHRLADAGYRRFRCSRGRLSGSDH
jgi:hypothetical protein